MDILDLVPQRRHQVLNSLLLLHQLVPWKQILSDINPISIKYFTEARCVDDGEELAGGVAQPVALVSTRPLRDAVQT